MPGERVGKVHEPRADAAVVHDRPAHDEKRDRKERERLRGRDEFLHQQVRHRRRVNKAEVGQRRSKERVGDRDAREIQHERDDDRQDGEERAHASTSPPWLLLRLRSLTKKDERVDRHQAEADDQCRADRGGRQLCDRHALDPGRLDKLHAEHRDVAVDDHEQGVGDQMHDPARA